MFKFVKVNINFVVFYFRVNYGKSRFEFVLFVFECDGFYVVLIGYFDRYFCCK